jgi:hypothetical protein
MTQGNPYWSQARQRQGQQSTKPQTPQQGQSRQKRVVRDDFGDEWVGKEVESKVTEGANVVVLRGRIVEVAKYWVKMMVDGNSIVYVNKAVIVAIKSLQ